MTATDIIPAKAPHEGTGLTAEEFAFVKERAAKYFDRNGSEYLQLPLPRSDGEITAAWDKSEFAAGVLACYKMVTLKRQRFACGSVREHWWTLNQVPVAPINRNPPATRH